MPYSSQRDVEFWGQFTSSNFGLRTTTGYTYASMIERAIEIADSRIDEHSDMPNSFFISGGIAIEDEYHDGVEIGHYGPYPSFGLLGYKKRPKLRFNYSPVISVKRVEEETSAGSWTTRTAGSASDYVLDREKDGIRFIANVPSYDYYNVRVSYIAGYDPTPTTVVNISGRLAAAIIRNILMSKKGATIPVEEAYKLTLPSLADTVFSSDMKKELEHYRRKVRVEVKW